MLLGNATGKYPGCVVKNIQIRCLITAEKYCNVSVKITQVQSC